MGLPLALNGPGVSTVSGNTGSPSQQPYQATAADPNQVFWIGSDGNAWLKNSSGVHNYGAPTNARMGGFDTKNFSAEARYINDPNPQAPARQGNAPGPTYQQAGSTGYSGGSSGYSGGAQAAARAAQVGQYDQAIGTYQNALNRLPGQLGIAEGNINTQFNTNQNQLNSTKDQSQHSYNNSTTQNGQSLQTNKNTISDQASNGLRGLMRMLGSYGAGGSSEALYTAPTAVADQATLQRSGAGQTFAQNQSGLDTNWNNFLAQDKNSRNQLNDWKTTQTNSAKAQSDTTKQNLLNSLAQLNGQRSAAAGGGYAAGAQPYLNQAQGLNSTIDNLGKLNPTYTGKTPVYTAPSLNSYVATAATGQASNQPTDGSTSPYLAQLLGPQKDKTNAIQ